MTTSAVPPAVSPSPGAHTRLRPLPATGATILEGFWAERQLTNRQRTLPHGFDQLRRHGTLDNLRLAAGLGEGSYQATGDSSGMILPFLDSDVYKWLEAAGWELGRGADPALAAAADEAIAVVAAAQRPDGYIDSYVQVVGGGQQHRDLAWSHEFYCVGHLIQAAIAWRRALGDDRLLTVAVRAADRIDREFGPGGRDGVDGHPCVEMALVELARLTGERKYAVLADRMLTLRGKGLIGDGRFGPEYWQDHEPVRTAAVAAGHAVRQLYLDCGVVDVATEVGDADLLAAARRRWDDLMRTRTYLTGGMGSRHRDEAFGDPFELPPDRAYAETCAAIASVMLAWRLLLATGDPAFADAAERAMFNGVLSGLSLTGDRFFYTNPLQRRTDRAPHAGDDGQRKPWYDCACCPPNLMRLMSTWHQYLATSDDSGVQLHQYASADVAADLPEGPVRLAVRTAYPWHGRIAVQVEQTPDEAWTLTLRVPGWCRSATVNGPDGSAAAPAGTVTVTRTWRRGDTVVLDLDLPVRVIEPDPRIDAVRGCVAVARGPIVYCVESADLPETAVLEDLVWDRSRGPIATPRPDVAPGVVGVDLPVRRRGGDPDLAPAIPYFAWANRGSGAMRVWIPVS